LPFVYIEAGSEPFSVGTDQLPEFELKSGRTRDCALGVVTWGTTVALEEVEEVFDMVEGGAALGS
jgi:hypothetical protein